MKTFTALLLLLLASFKRCRAHLDPCTDSRQDETSVLARKKRSATSDPERIWKDAIVPYTILSNFWGKEKHVIHQAIAHWEDKTCIRFVERTVENEYISFQKESSCGCCSFVGRRGFNESQGVNLGVGCVTLGTILHELGHVIGFWHEHTRPDRDKYLRIFTENVQPHEMENFRKKFPSEVDSLGVEFDYKSIMLYSSNTFAKTPFDHTLLPRLNPTRTSNEEPMKMGQRLQLSRLDALQANLLYRCPACQHTVRQQSGSLELKGNKSCEWRLVAPKGHHVIVRFDSLLFVGACAKTRLEAKENKVSTTYCRTKLPPKIVLTSDNELQLKFTSDVAEGQNSVMKATYHMICGHQLTSPSGWIQSPNYPNPYNDNAVCEWKIILPKNKRVNITLDFVKIEKSKGCRKDYLEIRDDVTGSVLGRFCRQPKVFNLVASENRVTVRFVSNHKKTKDGFSIRYQSIADLCSENNGNCSHKCDIIEGKVRCSCPTGYQLYQNQAACLPSRTMSLTVLPGQTGHIKPIGYPSLEPSRKVCTWTLQGLPGYRFLLKIQNLKLSTEGKDCSKNNDHLVISDTNTTTALKLLCSSYEDPIEVISNTESMFIQFIAKEQPNNYGFIGLFTLAKDECQTQNGGCDHVCQKTMTSYTCSCWFGYMLKSDGKSCVPGGCSTSIMKAYNGWITSPDYANQYSGDNQCTWEITSVPGQHLIIDVSDRSRWINHHTCPVSFETKPGKQWKPMTSPCQEFHNNRNVVTMNHLLRITYHPMVVPVAFNITYKSVCGGMLRAGDSFKSLLSHHGFPGTDYPGQQNCHWLITAHRRSRKRILVYLKTFNLESEPCEYDYVDFYDGRNKDAPLLAKLCGSDVSKRSLISNGNAMYIYFYSDEYIQKGGFEIEYKWVRGGKVGVSKTEDNNPPTTIIGGSRTRDYFYEDF